MAKRSPKQDPVEKAQRQVAQAQLKLLIAQDKRAAAIARGERAVRDAQDRTNQRVRKATERVERRAGAVARAEARLHRVADAHRPSEPDAAASSSPDITATPPENAPDMQADGTEPR